MKREGDGEILLERIILPMLKGGEVEEENFRSDELKGSF